MPKPPVLAWSLGRVELIGASSGEREAVTADTGPRPDDVACVGDVTYWSAVGERTTNSPGGGASHIHEEDGVHAISVDGATVALDKTSTGEQVATDRRDTLHELVTRDGSGKGRGCIFRPEPNIPAGKSAGNIDVNVYAVADLGFPSADRNLVSQGDCFTMRSLTDLPESEWRRIHRCLNRSGDR